MAQTLTVSTKPIRDLVVQLNGATEASANAAIESVIGAAERLAAILDPSAFAVVWDPQGPQLRQAGKDVKDAIKKLKSAKTLQDKKDRLLYLASTIEVNKALYSAAASDSSARAWRAFGADIANAPGLLVSNVIVPVVNTAAKMTGKTLLALIIGLWPILLMALAAVLAYGFVKGKALK